MVECTGNFGCGETVTVTEDEVVVYDQSGTEVGAEAVRAFVMAQPKGEREALLRALERSLKTASPSEGLPFNFVREQRPKEVVLAAQFDGDEDAAVAAGWVVSEFGLRCPKCERADGESVASLAPFSEFTALTEAQREPIAVVESRKA